jgi:hypothetical protein
MDLPLLAVEACKALDKPSTDPDVARFCLGLCKRAADAGSEGLKLSEADLDWTAGKSMAFECERVANQSSRDWTAEKDGMSLESAAGMAILLDGAPRSLEVALDLGWVDDFRVKMGMPKEDPDFVAWDIERLRAMGVGNKEAEERRWSSLRKSIDIALMPDAERSKWLSKCDAPDPSAWRPECPKKVVFARAESVSPMEMLLACEQTWGEAFEGKAAMLSRRGWRLSAALEGKGAVAGLAQKALTAAGRRGEAALAKLSEREAIEKASAIVGESAARTARL